jgi:hypothetical protein
LFFAAEEQAEAAKAKAVKRPSKEPNDKGIYA